MKVTHLISGLRGGGAEHLVLHLCRRSLDDREMEMSVVSLSNINDLHSAFNAAGIEVFFPANKKNYFSQAVSAIKFVLKQKAHTIHAHMYHGAIAACIVKLLKPKTRVIFTLHNTYQPGYVKRLLLFFTRPFRNSDIIFPGSKPAWYLKSNAIQIPNGIDLAPFMHFESVKPITFTLLFIGRITEQKNPFFLIDLAESLKPDYSFIIRVIGDGPLTDELNERIKENDLGKYIECCGYSNDVPSELAHAHCLIVPSLWEGMPLTVLEACAAGLPVVATPVGVLPDVLNNDNTFLAHLDEFPQAVARVMDNYGAALIHARLFKNEVFQKYSIDECYNAYSKIWKKRL